jgi:tetratricopeptide (TPR) repeat protein
MTIDSIGDDLESAYSLSEWLKSDEAGDLQRQLEGKILGLLFGQDPSSPAFQNLAIQLARIGSRPEERAWLEREITELDNLEDCSIRPCGLGNEIGTASKKVGSFIAEHKFEILVGIGLCATGVGLAYLTGYTLSVSVGGVVVAGTGSVFNWNQRECPKIPMVPNFDPQSLSKNELAAIQETIPFSLPNLQLPSHANELLVTADGVWVNGQLFHTDTSRDQSLFSQDIKRLSDQSDWRTLTYYNYVSSHLGGVSNHRPSYLDYGESALALGNYKQAVQYLAKAIEADPKNPISYIERGAALFGLGQYDASLEDYQRFASANQETYPLSVSEFSVGFAKGLPKGVYESGEGMLLFLTDFVKHPIQTSKQVGESVATLVKLAREDEWGVIAESLSPEVHQLVMEWDQLPSEKRGELAGYAVGKHGADILLPGAIGKVAAKSVKSAQELATVCRNLKVAQETLILEAATGVGSGVKVGVVVEKGQKALSLAEDLGLSAQEIGHLQKTKNLEAVLEKTSQYIADNPSLNASKMQKSRSLN